MADYVVQIDVDKQYLINSYMNAAKDIKQKAKGDVIEYRIQADEKTFYDSVKKLLSSGKLLKSDIKIGVDTDYYKQSLEKLKSYTGKTVKQIDDSLKKGLSDTDKYSLDNIISEKGWKNQTPDHLRKIIDDLVDDINKSFQNIDVTDFKQIDNLLEKAKKLQSVVDQVKVGKNADVLKERANGTSTYNSLAQKAIKQVRENYSKAVLQNKDKYISQMQTEMGNIEQAIQKNLTSLFNIIFDDMGNVRNEISDAISSGIEEGAEEGVEKAESAIQDLENRLDKLNKKKESLESNAKNNKTIAKSYQDSYNKIYSKTADGDTPRKTDISQYAESVKEYVATLRTGSEEYNKIKEEYKELVLLFEGTKLSKELPIFESFETYDKLSMNIGKEQLKATAKIEELKKQQIQKTSKEVQKQTSEINNNIKEVNIDVNEEQVIKSIQNIKEELNSLPEKKDININIVDNDIKIESEKEIEVKAKLSDGVNNTIQEELNALNPPTVKIDPELSEGFASKLQSKIDNIKDVKIKLKGNITSEEKGSKKKTPLSEEEKNFNLEADNLIKEFTFGSPITNKSQSAIREKLKDIIRKKQQNQEYNLDEIFNILSSDQTFLEDRYKQFHPDYYKLKNGLKDKTLRYSEADVAEFATPKDFQQARAKIGLKKLLPNQGQDPTEFLREIGLVNEELNTTQDAIKYIYDMLSNPPDLADDYFQEMFPSPEDEQEMYRWYDDKITDMSNKVDVKPVSSGLEEANILYAQELEETKMLQEKEASIYEEIQRARQDNQEQNITSNTNTPSSSIEKTESDVKELKSVFEQEGDVVKSIVQEEANALASLFDAIMLVQEAVDVKTKAFQEEGDVVDATLQGEVDSVNVLSLYLQSLKDDISNTFGSLSNDKIDFDGSNITEFIKKLSSGNADKIDTKLVTIFSSLSDFTDGINGLKINDDSILSSINNLLNKSKELENLATSIKAGKGQIKNVDKQTVGKQESKTENSKVEEAVKLYNQLYEARYKLSKIKEGTNETFSADYNRQIAEAEEGLKRLQLTEQERAEAEEKTSQKATKALNEELEAKRKLELNNKKLTESAEKTQQSVLKQATAFLSNGKVMREYGDRIHEIINEAKNMDVAFDPGEANSKLQALRKELDGIGNSAKIAGKSGQTFGQLLGQRFQTLAAYLGTFASFYDIIRYIREAASNVQELNKQMIELSKVSNQSITQIQKDFKSYSDTAKNIGATISDTISATADWARFNKIDPLYGNI